MDEFKISRILNREISLLILLSILAFAVFVFTRHMAAKEQQLRAKIAAVWYQHGVDFMSAGKTGDAIQSFRKATAEVGENPKYVLALASALAADNDNGEAERLLLQLRESDPQDPEINLALARLEANDGRVQEAVHYYQNAIYGRWPADAAGERRKLRLELVHLLLRSQQNNLAVSELLILQGSTPDSSSDHSELGQLFAQAGDSQRALQEYQAATELDANNVEALAGAGETAFRLEDYGQAEHYLRLTAEADPDSKKAQQLLTLTEMVQINDPLSPDLTPGERQQRLSRDLDLSLQRLDLCLNSSASSGAIAELQPLKTVADTLHKQLANNSKPVDSDAVKSGIALIFKIQKAASESCGMPANEDEALLLIGQKHSGERP